jgi:Flp pilus assembly pilin Flp
MLVMFEVFITILKNEDGFTAIEYGLIAAMVMVLASQVVSQF